MNDLIKLLTSMVGDRVPVAVLLKLVPVLAPVVADLTDGDPELSQDTRIKVQHAIEMALAGEIV